ncbi:MAG: UPF0280 family protein [Methanosphaera stadtmanae]|jgi:hypothetical protein|nr:UPF0280 family protein [Methanosphaera stadtmanae]
MYKKEEISIDSSHIHLTTDIRNVDLKPYIKKQRMIIQEEINRDKKFNGFEPVDLINSNRILYLMTHAGKISNTGPMSSVAGSISQVCMEYLCNYDTKYTIIENGGDISMKTNKDCIISIYAGESSLSEKMGLKIGKKKNGYGICTSSGTFGPSKSFGVCDACIVLSSEASISDALATSIANKANGEDDETIVNNALEYAEVFKEYYDCTIIIKNDMIAKIGRMPKLVNIESY